MKYSEMTTVVTEEMVLEKIKKYLKKKSNGNDFSIEDINYWHNEEKNTEVNQIVSKLIEDRLTLKSVDFYKVDLYKRKEILMSLITDKNHKIVFMLKMSKKIFNWNIDLLAVDLM